MDISTRQILTAVALHLDASIATRFKAAVPESADELSPALAGRTLAEALAPADVGSDTVRSCVLVGVLIERPGDALLIPPEAVPHHPLLAPWIGESLGDMVSRMLLSGVLWTGLSPGAPEFLTLELLQSADAFWADARLQFQIDGVTVNVLALYGPRPHDAPMARITRVSGQALFRIGEAIRSPVPGISDALAAAPPPPAQAPATVH